MPCSASNEQVVLNVHCIVHVELLLPCKLLIVGCWVTGAGKAAQDSDWSDIHVSTGKKG